MNIHPINTSFKDPQFCVYQDEFDRIYRRIQSNILPVVSNSPFFCKIIKSHENGLFEIEKFSFQSFYFEYPFNQLKDSALDFLNCLEFLINHDLIYVDGSPLNSTYQGNNVFLHFDFGSIQKLDLSKGWTGYKQFLTEWLWILYHLSQKTYIPAGYLCSYFNDNQWINFEKLSFKQKLRPSYWVHKSFLQSQKKESLKSSPSKDSPKSISKRNLLAFLELLKSDVKSAKLNIQKTKWHNYYSETVLQNQYLTKKESAFINLLKFHKIQESVFFVDWGANNGTFSRIICNEISHSKVIAIESDYIAANELYEQSRQYNIIPIHANIFNPTPAIGFSNHYLSLLERLKKVANVHVALGLIHHLQHQHNLNYEQIIKLFYTHSLIKSFLIIEFIGHNDERYKLIRNPNYPHTETIESFIEALEQYYVIQLKIQLTDDRCLFLAEKKDC